MKRLTMALFALTLTATATQAVAFDNFTEVTNVCPTCTQPPADVVTLNDGAKIAGKVIAENTAFYVFLRFGEVRAIQKREVQTIDWQTGSKPLNLTSYDQILLKSGHVISGTILEDKVKPALLQIRVSENDVTILVFKSEVAQLFRSGSEAQVKLGAE